MATSAETAVAKFREACYAYFADGDPKARAVVEYFETIEASASGIETPLCVECGVTLSSMDEARRGVYRLAKDEARRRAHAMLHERRRGALQRALFRDDRADNGEPVAWSNLRRAILGLQRFAAKYASMVGALPLFRGVLRLLVEQEASPKVIRWHLDAAVLTDSATEAFVDDAVALFRDIPLRRVRVDLPSIHLELHDSWSDVSLARLLNAVAARRFLSEDAARPTGRTDLTDRDRINVDGRLDHPPPILDQICLDYCNCVLV